MEEAGAGMGVKGGDGDHEDSSRYVNMGCVLSTNQCFPPTKLPHLYTLYVKIRVQFWLVYRGYFIVISVEIGAEAE